LPALRLVGVFPSWTVSYCVGILQRQLIFQRLVQSYAMTLKDRNPEQDCLKASLMKKLSF